MEETGGKQFVDLIIPGALLAAYGWSWQASIADPAYALTYLVMISALVTLPYFLFMFFQSVVGGKMITGCLLILGLLVPILQIFLLIWIAIAMIAKFAAFIQNLPLILVGLVFYALTWYVPQPLHEALLSAGAADSIAVVGVVLAGAALFALFLKTAASGERSLSLSAALALGAACYVLLFMLFLLIPGDPGGDFDGGQDRA